jgi:hypothetical protein
LLVVVIHIVILLSKINKGRCLPMLKKHTMVSWLLAFCLCFAIAMPTFAVATDEFGKVMPNEVLAAINGKGAASLSAQNGNTDFGKVFMKTSLGITIPKVDLDEVHVTVPLTDNDIDKSVKQQLREHGYTDAEIADMDLGDYINISATWTLPADVINVAKDLYPELANEDLSDWTYGQYNDYKYEVAVRNTMPSPSEIVEFAARGITYDDANWLLKDYYSYEEVLAQSDETLKAALEDYYRFLIRCVAAYAKADTTTGVTAENDIASNSDMPATMTTHSKILIGCIGILAVLLLAAGCKYVSNANNKQDRMM